MKNAIVTVIVIVILCASLEKVEWIYTITVSLLEYICPNPWCC